MSRSTVLVVLVSVVAIGLVVWWDWSVFSEVGIDMPAAGWIALVLGVVVTVIVGCGLMFLVFYSSRHGYDDAASRGDGPPPPADRP